jgi:anti-sigma B factor antagonist
MTIEERTVGSMVVLHVSGRITLGDGEGVLKEAVTNLLKQGRANLLLNMAEVSYVDSSGLGALVGSSLAARRQGGAVKLLNPSRRLHDLLSMSRLLQVIEVCDSEAQALETFEPDRGVAKQAGAGVGPPEVDAPLV